jgi:predicted enzyme related to lactoylglutathione lyase
MPQITQAHPVLPSLDWDETTAFYEKLGFAVMQRYDNYLIVHRDGIQLHFQKCNDRKFAENTVCYIRVSDADALQKEFVANGVKCSPPLDRSWGPREFNVIDCNGTLLRMGGPAKPKGN